MSQPLFVKQIMRAVNASVAVVLCAAATGLVVLRVQGMRPLTVATDSMQPIIHHGDLVVASVVRGWPEAGQIISYNSTVHPGEIVTHRVQSVDVVHGYLVTKGDNAATTDNPIRQAQVIGRVRWHSATAGKAIKLLRNPYGLVATVYLPALLVIVYELRRVMRRYHQASRYQIYT